MSDLARRLKLEGQAQQPLPVDRLLSDTPKKTAWLLRQQAIEQRVIIDHLRDQAAGRPSWLKRWVG
jgi:hypothetical protein